MVLEERAVEPGTLRRVAISPDAPRDDLVAAICGAALRAKSDVTLAWGIAVPGPFDYAGGVARFRGVHKLDALYGTDLRAELAAALGLAEPSSVRFVNDASAFLLGEWWAGAVAGLAVAIGVTCGSGLGSAFLRDGELIDSGPGVPPEARLDLLQYRGTPVEDVVSARGLVAAYREGGGSAVDGADVARRGRDDDAAVVDGAAIARRARDGDAAAVAALRGFGEALGEVLAPWVAAFAPRGLVVGGSIAASFDLFGPAMRRACPPLEGLDFIGPAAHLEEAPLLGAAYHAARPAIA